MMTLGLARHGRTPVLLGLYGAAALGLGLFLGWLAIRDFQWGELGAILASVNPFGVVLAFVAVLGAGYLRGVRWHLLLQRRVRAGRLFLIEQAGSALDTLSLVHVLDEVVETSILTVRDRVALGSVLATMAMQRTLEFGTTALVLTGGALLLEPMRRFWPYLVVGLAFSALSILLLFTVGPALTRVRIISRIPLAKGFGEAAALMRQQPKTSLQAFGLSVVQALLIGLGGWLLAASLDLGLSIPAMVVVTLGVMFFASMVPGLPMAFGTLEFAAVALLGLWGKEPANAVVFAIALRGELYLPPLLIAAVFLPREGLSSVLKVRQLATEVSRHRLNLLRAVAVVELRGLVALSNATYLFTKGGLRVLDAKQDQDYDVLGRRPVVTGRRKLRLIPSTAARLCILRWP